jgi:hypothetical protein
MRIAPLSCLVCLAAGILAVATSARADDCTLATNAAIAQAKVPHADTHVTTLPGKPPVRIEMIFTADKAYSETNGSWTSFPFSAQTQIDIINAATKRAEQTAHACQKLPSEPINGEAASLFTTHTADGKVAEARIWISDKTGLPLKSEVRLGSGTIVTDEFRYGSIAAPPGAK